MIDDNQALLPLSIGGYEENNSVWKKAMIPRHGSHRTEKIASLGVLGSSSTCTYSCYHHDINDDVIQQQFVTCDRD